MSYHWSAVSLIYEDGNYVFCNVRNLPSDEDLRTMIASSFQDMDPEIIRKIQLDFEWIRNAPIDDVIEAILDFAELIFGYDNRSGEAWVSISKVQGPRKESDVGSKNINLLARNWTAF